MRWRLAALLFAGMVAPVHATSIDVAFADGSPCFTAEPVVPFTVHIFVSLTDPEAECGISGAEFRLSGTDPSWFAVATPNPGANLVLGNPLQGVNIGFPAFQSGTAVALFSISFTAFGPITPHHLQILEHTTPSNPNFPCPLVTICPPVFPLLCVPGGEAFLNDPDHDCRVAVEARSWSGLKALFR